MSYRGCNGIIYTVKPGDTLYKISGKYGIPLAMILRANPFLDIYNLQAGDRICIPMNGAMPTQPTTMYTVKPNDTIQRILDENKITLDELIKENPLDVIYLQEGTKLKLPKKMAEPMRPEPRESNMMDDDSQEYRMYRLY